MTVFGNKEQRLLQQSGFKGRSLKSGDRLGRLSLQSEVPGRVDRIKSRAWVCVCDCGTTVTISEESLRYANIGSCGCIRVEENQARIKHGGWLDYEYPSWNTMIVRCRDGKYKGRVHVCERWLDYANFKQDMGPRPRDATLDRIDNNGHYEPGNCRWATKSQQARNRNDSIYIVVNGMHIFLDDAIKALGVSRAGINARRRKGETPQQAYDHFVKRLEARGGRRFT